VEKDTSAVKRPEEMLSPLVLCEAMIEQKVVRAPGGFLSCLRGQFAAEVALFFLLSPASEKLPRKNIGTFFPGSR